jgi:hypothetical protein
MVIEKNLIKLTSAKVKKRNSRDSSLLHFMFIRDAIGMFPRLQKSPSKSVSKGAVKGTKPKHARYALENILNIEQFNASQMVYKLAERLEAYDALLEKIDYIAHHALTIVDGTQVGGRKPSLEVKKMVIKSAIDYHTIKGRYPSAATLCEIIRRDLFKNSPQKFIDIVAKKLDVKEVEIHRVNPTWNYWKHIDGVVSEKTISNILFELRVASPTI